MSLLLASSGSSATVFTYVGTGGLAFGGAADVARTFTYTASGGLTLAGTAPISTTVVPSVSGGTTFGGSATTEFIPAVASTSTSTGGGWFSWVADRVRPKPAAKAFQFAPSGGVSLGGTSPSSFTSVAPRRRREEEVAILFALMG